MADQPQSYPLSTSPNEPLVSPGGKMPQTQATDPTNLQQPQVQQSLQKEPLPTLPPKKVFSKKLLLIIPFIILISIGGMVLYGDHSGPKLIDKFYTK